MSEYMKEPCLRCPFRRDVKPYITEGRWDELAYATANKYNYFPCHKTTVYNEENESMDIHEKSKECAGFLTMQVNQGRRQPEGFELSDLVFEDAFEMIQSFNALD